MEQQNILIVEDDADISGLLAKILEGAGYQICQAFSGTEALFCMERKLPDCVLLDLMIPGMTGEEVLTQIRKEKKEMPVLILSAKVSVQDKVRLLRIGADDYMTKPFDPEEVIARIEAALERIFLNLLQNAGRYAHQFLQVFVIEKEKQVWICFENDVENMKEEDVERLFERFYMKEKARTQGGTGLGLTVAKQLANAMGADLAADLLREAEKEAKESVQKLRFTLVMKKV